MEMRKSIPDTGSDVTGSSNHYCLKWSNFSVHVAEILTQLLKTQSMVDITLCAGGERIFAHRAVLCAYSSYFKDILSQVDDPHPVVILSEMSAEDVSGILEFLYCGKLNVDAKRVSTLLKVAESLQIRTLMEVISHLHNFSLSEEDQSTAVDIRSRTEVPSLELAASDIIVAPMEMEVALAVEVSGSFHDVPHHDLAEQQESIILESNKILESHLPQRDMDQFDPQIYCQNGTLDTGEMNERHEDIQCRNSDQPAEMEKAKERKPDFKEKKRRKRRENCRKDYSEEQLNSALADLRAGRFLGETAATHRIPRSTLYVRAKAAGVPITITRHEHSAEQIRAAINSVVGGASLQQASSLYQIPKTVLWRRVQSAGGRHTAHQKQAYSIARRQAAVQALQSGQTLSKVSDQFQIPKTTLFREKARLVETGKLPWNTLRRKNSTVAILKQTRLSEAVSACQQGKMSQAIASATFQVPKTTIWRRLKKKQHSSCSVTEESASAVDHIQGQSSFTFCEGNNEIPIAYIVDGAEFPETPIIM